MEVKRLKETELSLKDGKYLVCKGPLGKVSKQIGGKDVILGSNKILLKSKSSYIVLKSLLEMVLRGTNKGYFKELEFVGLGYRFLNLKKGIFLKVGYSHYIKLNIPKSVKVIGFKTRLIVFGIDLEEVNRVASQIKSLKKADRYKGKGIRYENETINLKVGKQS